MEAKKKWFAVYTKPRWEKKVHAGFLKEGIESYCPLNRVSRQWSDRVKVVMEPLFKSYVFVRIAQPEQSRVRMVGGVLNFVYSDGRPATIRDEEIDTIRRFLDEYEDVRAERMDIKPDTRVMINKGVLMNNTGVVLKVWGNRVEVLIESLGYQLVAHVPRSNLSINP